MRGTDQSWGSLMAGDFDELMSLSKDLDASAAAAVPNLRKAVQVTLHNVKTDAQATVRGRKGFGHAANAITYDTAITSTGIEGEAGYDKDRPAGALGNLIEFGAPNAKAHMLVNGKNVPVPGAPARPLAPSHDLGNALLNNEDDFEYGVQRAIDDTLKELGL